MANIVAAAVSPEYPEQHHPQAVEIPAGLDAAALSASAEKLVAGAA